MTAVPPQGAYVPAVVHGGLAWTAGMTPRRHGELDDQRQEAQEPERSAQGTHAGKIEVTRARCQEAERLPGGKDNEREGDPAASGR